MALETTGRLHTVFDTNKVSDRFTKREFVLELADNPKYPQLVMFQLTGDRCAQLDGLNVGDAVRVEFSLRGREWRSPKGELKYFNSLDVWRVEPADASSGRSQGGGRRGGGGSGGRGRSDDGPPADGIPRGGDDDYAPRGGGRPDPDDDLPF